MRSYFVSGLVWVALAAVGFGQSVEPRTQSVIRPAGYGWRNHVVVPDGPCGCAMPVRADCYDKCCFHCGLRPICLLHRVGRMLDCLLPCNACCGPLGGPLLAGRGCCGTCGPVGCATAAPYSSYGPAYGDPFLDDPLPMPALPPTPTPSPSSEVRSAPSQRSSRSVRPADSPASPWKITSGPATSAPVPRQDLHASSQRATHAPAQPSGQARSTNGQSILRRASAEEAIAPALHSVDTAQARPIVRSQSPATDDDDGAIPHNPLRK